MNITGSTREQCTQLIAFRQAVYDQFLTRARDAQFDLLEVLTTGAPATSLAELSLSPLFQRRWESVYAALRRGRQDQPFLDQYLAAWVPATGPLVLALDGTAWPHPQAHTLAGLQYVYSPGGQVRGQPVVVGHTYSALCWVPEAGQSWALPLSVVRLPAAVSAAQRGAAQVRALLARLAPHPERLVVVVADAKYGTWRFLRPLQGSESIIIVRLRKDRVLYGPPPPYPGRGRRDLKHGARFAFKDPATWGEPVAEVCFTDPTFGQVRLRAWDHLHMEEAADTPFRVVLCETHRERAEPDRLWLACQAAVLPAPAPIWRWYQYRWPVEPSFRFRKQRLSWTLPRLQETAACDRWTQLVSLAQWQLWLARALVADQPLPWHKPQPTRRTPGRVQRGMAGLIAAIGSPAHAPQTRGQSPGWPAGRVRQPPARYAVVKHSQKQAKVAKTR